MKPEADVLIPASKALGSAVAFAEAYTSAEQMSALGSRFAGRERCRSHKHLDLICRISAPVLAAHQVPLI